MSSQSKVRKGNAQFPLYAALGALGPATLITPITGGTTIQRGESVRRAWLSTGNALKDSIGKFRDEVEKQRSIEQRQAKS